MSQKLKVGDELVIYGYKWVQVQEIMDDGETAWAIDKDGESHEVSYDMADHIYQV